MPSNPALVSLKPFREDLDDEIKEQKGMLHVAFLDIASAYDTVDHKLLKERLALESGSSEVLFFFFFCDSILL